MNSDRPVIMDIPGLHWSTTLDDVWVCGASDHSPMCRLCQKLDGTLEALLGHVADGRMEWKMLPNGELGFKMTELGMSTARSLVKRLTDEEPQS